MSSASESGQVENFRFPLCREQVSQSDLVGGTDHTIGLHAAKLGILDDHRLSLAVPAHHRAGTGDSHTHPLLQVDAAADDILDLSVADIHLADSQLVRVGMGFDLLDHADDHVVKTAGQILHILHFHRGHGQIICQLL